MKQIYILAAIGAFILYCCNPFGFEGFYFRDESSPAAEVGGWSIGQIVWVALGASFAWYIYKRTQ